MRDTYDVMILGGGLAGLTAALQLKQTRPATRIVVVEKREHPVPEAAFKVGESGAEIGCYYLAETIDFQQHMDEHQLRKFSLRIFPTANGNTDITRRPEIGFRRPTPMRTYQFDRGRLENALAEAVVDAGVDLLDGHQAADVALGDPEHSVTVRRGDTTRELRAKWIIDASGRVGLLRRQLGLTVPVDNDVNAAWFRLDHRLKIDEFSDDAAWGERILERERWFSTNQLIGEGYWVWIIPLGSEATSVGIVADDRFVPFDRIRRYDALMEWMREHEPELARHLPEDESGLLDFKKLKNYAFGTRRGLSGNRWCLTGEAGLFIDPLYSTGLDFIAVANTLATDLIKHALDGETGQPFRRRLKTYNSYYLGQFLAWAPTFEGQYEVFRDGQATAAKILWDNASYFRFPVHLFFNEAVTDPDVLAALPDISGGIHPMNVYVQSCLRELSRHDLREAGYPAGTNEGFLELFTGALNKISKPELMAKLEWHMEVMSALLYQLLEPLYEAAGIPMPPAPVEKPEGVRDHLVHWIDYEHRNTAPSEAAPQPETAWQIV